MIKVINEIKSVTDGPTKEVLVIKNHWNYTDRVVLICGGKELIFLANDLIAAIENAKNTARY